MFRHGLSVWGQAGFLVDQGGINESRSKKIGKKTKLLDFCVFGICQVGICEICICEIVVREIERVFCGFLIFENCGLTIDV